MKILIVDDNAAIREIIKDILTDEGHNVRIASTVDEAVSKTEDFSPEVLVLDSKVADDDGLRVLSQLSPGFTPDRLRVVLIKGAGELAPTDNPYIRASVDKPFKSSDIVDAVRGIQAEEMEEAVAATESRRRGLASLKGLLRRRPRSQPQEEDPLTGSGVSFGSSYVMFEEFPSDIYGFIGLFDPDEYDIMVVTTDKAKAIKERFSYEAMEVLPLSANGRGGSLAIQQLGTMTHTIRGFMDSRERPVIVFDSFGDIISADGMNQSLLMLQQLMAGRTRMCTFAVSVDGSLLTDKDRNIFLHSMIEYVPKE